MPSQKFTITLTRNGMQGFLSQNSIETDAINALESLPNVSEVNIINSTELSATANYSWSGTEKIQNIQEHLFKFGLRRI